MTDEQKAIALLMVKEGKTIVSISEDLGLDWDVITGFVHSEDALSWLGAKNRITHRLNRLKEENDPAVRERLADEVYDIVNYIYYSGKEMGRAIDDARKALGSKPAGLAE